MTNEPDYRPSPTNWVREQVEAIEASADTRAVQIQGRPVVLLTMRGARSGALRKVPLMRVERGGAYAAVASRGGAPTHPQWFHNLLADPRITLQDGTQSWPAVARLLEGAERDQWWERCVAAFPTYADYARKAERTIPVFLIERAG